MDTIEIKQKINNTSVPPTIFNEGKYYSAIHIARKYEKYGVVRPDGEEILPFEYDNISMAGFGIYQLSKGGKLGIADICKPNYDDYEPYVLRHLTPCVYDVIEYPQHGESFVLLRKDKEDGSEMQIYFPKSAKLSEEVFWRVEHTDRDFLVAIDNSQLLKAFDREGNNILTVPRNEDAQLLIPAYESKNSTVFLTVNEEDDVSNLFFAMKRKTEPDMCCETTYDYELTGEIKKVEFGRFLWPVLSIKTIRTHERPFVEAFFIMRDNDVFLLDGDGERMIQKALDHEIYVSSNIRGKTFHGIAFDIELRKSNVVCEYFEDIG